MNGPAQPAADARLVASLQQLLALLDEPNTDAAALDRAGDGLRRLFDEVREGGEQLEHAAQLNAVARQMAGRRLGLIDAQLQRVRSARRALEPDARTRLGERCDVDG